MKWKRSCAAFLGLTASMQIFAAVQQADTAGNASSAAYHGSTKEAVAMAASAGNSFIYNNLLSSSDRPDWLTRTYISYELLQKNKPEAEILTTQPIFMDKWNTYFWQARFAYYNQDGTGNIGLGYRYLTDDRQMMWGLNLFYDESFHYRHQRLGLGGEFFTPFITVRANYYDAISRTRNTGTSSITGITSYERALTGYDASIETPLPYVSWTRLMATGYRWRGDVSAGMNGGGVTLRMFPVHQLEVDAGMTADNVNGPLAFLKFDYYLGSPAFIQYDAVSSSYRGMYAPLDLEKQRLQKVIRHNDIVVESTTNGAGGTGITVGRGT